MFGSLCITGGLSNTCANTPQEDLAQGSECTIRYRDSKIGECVVSNATSMPDPFSYVKRLTTQVWVDTSSDPQSVGVGTF